MVGRSLILALVTHRVLGGIWVLGGSWANVILLLYPSHAFWTRFHCKNSPRYILLTAFESVILVIETRRWWFRVWSFRERWLREIVIESICERFLGFSSFDFPSDYALDWYVFLIILDYAWLSLITTFNSATLLTEEFLFLLYRLSNWIRVRWLLYSSFRVRIFFYYRHLEFELLYSWLKRR